MRVFKGLRLKQLGFDRRDVGVSIGVEQTASGRTQLLSQAGCACAQRAMPGAPIRSPACAGLDSHFCCRKSSRSLLSRSLVRVGESGPPHGRPMAFLISLAEARPDASIGTIWSSSPCTTRVGTSKRFRSSCEIGGRECRDRVVGALLRPPCMPCAPERLDGAPARPSRPGRLKPKNGPEAMSEIQLRAVLQRRFAQAVEDFNRQAAWDSLRFCSIIGGTALIEHGLLHALRCHGGRCNARPRRRRSKSRPGSRRCRSRVSITVARSSA